MPVNPENSTGLKPIRRALLSVTDKSGLIDFARTLSHCGTDLISTGGTAKALREAGLAVRDISELTGFPEMLDGRVKTLHPKVHGGILHIRDNPAHVAAVEAHAIEPIDMVVVNLYAFEKTAQKHGVSPAEIIENIDIGGPSMLRSAAKNFEDVAVVTSASDYATLTGELHANSGSLSRETRWQLAKQAFAVTAAYDAAIASTLETIKPSQDSHAAASFDAETLPQTLRIIEPQSATLRYGENPHQQAALYTDGSGTGVAAAQQLQGKELSYNNLVDLDACWELVSEFDEPAVVIIKHTNPCGAATGSGVLDAYKRALAADPISAFGGVIGANREVDGAAAEEIAKLFVEAIVAPAYSPEALQRFAAKKNLRLIQIKPAHNAANPQTDLRRSPGADSRPPQGPHLRPYGHHQAPAVHGRVARASVCLDHLQARQIERDRLRPLLRRPRPDGRHRRRTDVPRGRCPLRRDEGCVTPRGNSRRVRRLLSLPRWPGGSRPGRCDRRHPARRVHAR